MAILAPWKISLLTALAVLLIQYIPVLSRAIRVHGSKRLLKIVLMRFLLKFTSEKMKLQEVTEDAVSSFKEAFLKYRDNPIKSLPKKGMSPESILEKINSLTKIEDQFISNRISGSIYIGSEELNKFVSKAMKKFNYHNTLHFDMFTSTSQMESEIVQMTINLYNGNEKTCGVLTTGGTESIILAMLAYREWGKLNGISHPEILVSTTAHAAFFKAAFYLNMTIIKLEPDKNYEMDLKKLERAINRNTVVIVGSAPNYAFGTFDPLEEMGELALRKKTNFHIDACLGGFLNPFVAESGFEVEKFDFTVDGVTSISCDPHKYALTPKGVSVIMYNSPELRRLEYFALPDWTGGCYTTPCLGGSRPGNNSVGAWATLMYMGRESYIHNTEKILQAAFYLKQEIKKIPDLYVLGDPKLSIVAYASTIVNVHAVTEELSKIRKWTLNNLLNPRSTHFCVTMNNLDSVELFIEDLKQAIDLVKAEDPKKYQTAALYGMAASIPDTQVTGEILKHACDCMYEA